ncbi:MAG: hypothetical protein HFJ45_00345 [Clostridia bacterium]|nr:hypothetical protein [Clostridia bacterium]
MAKTDTVKGTQVEEIEILHSGEAIAYKTDEIGFDELVSNLKSEIMKKDWVMSLEEKRVGKSVILEITSAEQKLSVVLSPSGSMRIENGFITTEGDPANFNYVVDGNEVHILGLDFSNFEYEKPETGYGPTYGTTSSIINLNMETLIIPAKIDGKTVTEVKFIDNKSVDNLSSAIVVKGVKEIVYPETVKVIGSSDDVTNEYVVFKDIETIVLPNELVEIGSKAFWFNTKVTNLLIPSKVERIVGNPFIGMSEDLVIEIEGKDSEMDFEEFNGFYIDFDGAAILNDNIHYLGK